MADTPKVVVKTTDALTILIRNGVTVHTTRSITNYTFSKGDVIYAKLYPLELSTLELAWLAKTFNFDVADFDQFKIIRK